MAVSREKESFHQRTGDELKGLSNRLLIETVTDESGNFILEFSEKVKYDGGAFDIDFECGADWVQTLPGAERRSLKSKGPFQFHITTLQPLWKELSGNENMRMLIAYWEYGIPYGYWCRILRLFGLYVICGKVQDCKHEIPVAGVKVFAYDVDLIQDDYLGFGVTYALGNFKIYYSEADFSKTIFSGLNIEWPAGPDLYFRIEAGECTVLLNENRQRGHDRDRTNASNCFCINFCVECPKGSLVCGLTAPTGYIESSDKLLNDQYITVVGTASGCGMANYDQQLFWNGTKDVSAAAIVYSNIGGNPDPSLLHGSHAVMNGNLGFIDLKKAIDNAGSDMITSTMFEIRLTVHGGDKSVCSATLTFAINASEVYIKNIGGRVAHDVLDPAEQLRIADAAGADIGAIGLGVSIWGAARVFGCANQKIKNYGIYFKKDDLTTPQPGNGTAFDPLTNGFTTICNVDYAAGFSTFSADELRQWNVLKGPDSLISNNGFYTYDDVVSFYFNGYYITLHFSEGLVAGMSWDTSTRPSGKYTVLLKVTNTSGYSYYDIQRVWVDNETIMAKISDIGNLPACSDLYTKDHDGNFKIVDINGIAFDPLIIAGDLNNPSDNFDHYRILIQKQGSAPEEIYHSTTPVPGRAPAPPSTNIYSFDLSWLNTTAHVPGDNKLLDNEKCAFVFTLQAWDKTALNNNTTVHYAEWNFPVKIINSNQP